MGVSVGLLVNRMWNAGSDVQAGVEIYHWGSLRFWLILSSQNDPFFGPQFHPPVWSVGGCISLCLWGSRTQLQVVHLDTDSRSCLLSCGPWGPPWLGGSHVEMTPVLVILASSWRIRGALMPGPQRGPGWAEGSRDFLLEGHRVSCLVPTSGRSGRGVHPRVSRANISLG